MKMMMSLMTGLLSIGSVMVCAADLATELHPLRGGWLVDLGEGLPGVVANDDCLGEFTFLFGIEQRMSANIVEVETKVVVADSIVLSAPRHTAYRSRSNTTFRGCPGC